MPVTEQTPVNSFTANGVTTAFGYGFLLLDDEDLIVTVGDLVRQLNVDYTVSGVGNPGGGTVTMTTAPLSGSSVILQREIVAERQTDYQDNGDLLAQTLDVDFDRLWLALQGILEQLSRALRVPVGFGAPSLPSPEAARFLRWRDDLTGLQNADLAALGTLGLPVAIAEGGTGASSQSEAIENLGFIDVRGETTLNGGGSLDLTALGRAFLLIDSGSPANYTINLPVGAPNGSLIMFRVGGAATKLYTLTGVDVGIDGLTSRTLWRNESCLLLREGGNWTKIGGRTIPFRGVLQRTSSQSITAGTTWQKCTLQDEVGDASGLDLCFDVANGRFSAPRASSFSFSGYLSIAASVSVSAADADLALSLNGGGLPTAIPATLVRTTYPVGGSRIILNGTGQAFPVNAGGYVELLGRISGGGTIGTPSFEYVGSSIIPSLSYSEAPLW